MNSIVHGAWEGVSRLSPCTICGGITWCSRRRGDPIAICRRLSIDPVSGKSGFEKKDIHGNTFWVYGLSHTGHRETNYTPPSTKQSPVRPSLSPQLRHQRHQMYAWLLQRLTLSQRHFDHLAKRGLSQAQITTNQYKSLPSSFMARQEVVRELQSTFGDLCHSLPGVDRPRLSLHGPSGILIPLRSIDGHILALKIRRDESSSSAQHSPRYCYFSSTASGGASSGTHVHIPLFHREEKNIRVLRVTEGELKADVSYFLSNVLTISVPGVATWALAMPVLHHFVRHFQTQMILVSFDQDIHTNPFVKQNFLSFLNTLTNVFSTLNIQIGVETWTV